MSSPLRAAAADLEWGRPRRQTNPDVVRRPSVLLRQATLNNNNNKGTPITNNTTTTTTTTTSPSHHAPSSPLAADQRPRTSQTSSSASSTTVTPTKRNSHRSSLSVSALSNPALAEIPSRKYNALRLSTGSDNNSSNVQCDMASPSDIVAPQRAAANAAATSTSPRTPRLTSLYSDRSRSNSVTLSPSSRKTPASRSSLGADVFAHHPFSQDRAGRPYSTQHSPPQQQSTTPKDSFDSPSIDAVLRRDSLSSRPEDPVSPDRRRGSTPLSPRSSAARSRMAFPTADDPYRTTKLLHEQIAEDASTDDSRSRSDDIFLNIAKTSVSGRRDSLGKLDRRRVSHSVAVARLHEADAPRQKLGLSTRTSLATEQTPSPEHVKYQSSPVFLQDGSPMFSSNHSTTTSVNPSDEPSRLRQLNAGSTSRSVVSVPRSRYNRDTSPELPLPHADVRSTITDTRSRHSRTTSISSRAQRQPAPSSDAVERAQPEVDKTRNDGTTESSLSTTAPSTVWDELDDLKSRIRKLELTGKFPASSAAAMSNVSVERPRTAATTATTLSSSPKQKHIRKTSLSVDLPPPTPNPIQTLLHSALAKAKTNVGNEVYGVLETTATDALTLANMLGSTTTSTPSGTASSVNGSGMTERQAKRKADSLCRSLTELCLAISDEQALPQQEQQRQSQEPIRPISQGRQSLATIEDNGDSRSSTATRFRRSMSHEPESFVTPDSALRVLGRLENRRANTINFGASTHRDRLSHDEQSSPQTSLNASHARLNRLSGPHRLRREDDSDDRSSVFSRTLSSRAMTEVGGYSSSRLSNTTRERMSREYANESPSTRLSTSYQQGSPHPPKTSPSVHTTTPIHSQRRSYATPPSSGIPTASGVNIQPGFRRYGVSTSTHGTPSDSPSQVESVPQTRITSASSKTATSYTAIQQPRMRTESLSSRRLGLRLRPSVIGQENDQ